jgi:hypothetical protein
MPKSSSGPNLEKARVPSRATKKSIKNRIMMEKEAQRKRTTVIG